MDPKFSTETYDIEEIHKSKKLEKMFYDKDIDFIKKRDIENKRKFRYQERHKSPEATINKKACFEINSTSEENTYELILNEENLFEDSPLKKDFFNENLSLSANFNDSVTSQDYSFTSNFTIDENFEEIGINSESEEENNHDSTEIEKLYVHSDTTVKEFSLYIIFLKYKHKLSKAAIDDFLILFKNVLPENNKVPKNTDKICKMFSSCETNTEQFTICSNKICEKIFPETSKEKIQSCSSCTHKTGTFSVYKFIPQIESLLANENYLKQIINSNKREKNNFELRDALDGSLYQYSHKENCDLSVSFNINTDGAPLIKTNNFSIWPVLGSIVELNHSSREKFDNIIIFGMWLSDSKPSLKFFDMVFDDLIKLKQKKLQISGFSISLRCHAGIFDLPAKSMILNIKQFNGKFGCVSCYHPGQAVSGRRVYTADKFYEKKTFEEYLKYPEIFHEMNLLRSKKKDKESIFGIFGRSVLSKLLIISDQIPFDVMHLVFQGHVKWILNELMNNKNLDDLYLGNNIEKINSLLSKIRYPHTFNRKSKFIENFQKWKSSEIKNFLFYTALPLLVNILPDWYFYRLISYIISIRILYEPVKNLNDLNIAEEILKNYVKDIEDSFSINALTYTLHAHLHLVDQVKAHGPLAFHSQFFFEGGLINFKNHFHGTRGFLNQISKQIFLFKDLAINIEQTNFMNKNLNELIKKKSCFNGFNQSHINNNFCLKLLSTFEKNILKDKFEILSDKAFIGEKIFINNKIFHSKSYSRKGKTNSFSISFSEKSKTKQFAEILHFLKINETLYAFIQKFETFTNLNEILPNSTGFFL